MLCELCNEQGLKCSCVVRQTKKVTQGYVNGIQYVAMFALPQSKAHVSNAFQLYEAVTQPARSTLLP